MLLKFLRDYSNVLGVQILRKFYHNDAKFSDR